MTGTETPKERLARIRRVGPLGMYDGADYEWLLRICGAVVEAEDSGALVRADSLIAANGNLEAVPAYQRSETYVRVDVDRLRALRRAIADTEGGAQ